MLARPLSFPAFAFPTKIGKLLRSPDVIGSSFPDLELDIASRFLIADDLPASSRSLARPLFAALLFAATLAGPDPATAQSPATTPSTTPATVGPLIDQPTIRVARYRVEGSTVFTAAQLADTLRPFTGEGRTFEDLDAARTALTSRYVDAGYINSGAVLPDQEFDPAVGEVRLVVIEGRLSEIDIAALGELTDGPNDGPNGGKRLRLRDAFVRDRLRRAASPVLDRERLGEALEQLRQNPNVDRVVAELEPGRAPGEANLKVLIDEADPLRLAATYANSRPPSVGADELTLSLGTTNLTGNADALFVDYAALRGGWEDGSYALDFARDDVFAVGYVLPLNASDAALSVAVSRSDELVTQKQFAELDINTRSTNVDASLRQPLVRRRTTDAQAGNRYEELAAVVGVGHRRSESFLLGERFDFSDGSRAGKTRVNAARLGVDYARRGLLAAASASATIVVGFDAADATVRGDDGPDTQFLALRAQVQAIRRFNDATDARVIVRAVSQLTRDALPSVEQFSLGGAGSVRGYRENRTVRDSGVWGGVELRLPLLPFERRASLELAPFVDAGYGWNTAYARDAADDVPGDGEALVSVGCGLVWAPNDHFDAQVFYGHALTNRDGGDDLQDDGVPFAFTLRR